MNDEHPPSTVVLDLEKLVAGQQRFFASGKTLPLEFRREVLSRFAEEIEKRADDFLEALAADLGKPPIESYLSEVWYLLKETRYFAKKLRRWAKPQRVSTPFHNFPARSEIRREPFGNVVVVAPWNFPAQLSLSPLLAAVAAGNCVVLKPSELAPATANLLDEVVSAVFDPGHVAVVQGGPDVGQALLEQPFDYWFYTGSEKVGRLFAAAAAKNLAPVTLELGGKCPCVVDADVPLDETVERIVIAKFFNAGQTCIAPDFVLVPESLREAFVEKAAALLKQFYGEGKSPDLARIVNASHYDRLLSLVEGETIRIGEDDREENYLAPRILPEADWNDKAMQDEIFGPVLPVLAYADLDEALSRVGELPSPLALYAFSRNRNTLEKAAASVRSGTVCFNDAVKQVTNLKLPFGGAGRSGMGRYRGRAGFEAFSYTRSFMKRYLWKDVFAIKPPYGSLLEKVRRFLK